MSPAVRAAALTSLGIALIVADVLLTALGGRDVGFATLTSIAVAPYLATGYLIAARRPSNPIGWSILALPLFFVASTDVGQVALLATADPAVSGPATWLSFWFWVPGWLALGMTFLVFPDGHLPPRYGRALASAMIAATAAALVLAMIDNDPRGSQAGLPNPLALDVPISLYELLIWPLLVVFVAPAVAVVVRYQRSTERIRRQLKWLAYGSAVLVVLAFSYLVAGLRAAGGAGPTDVIFLIAIAAPAVAIGIAILRDRVFDIDVLIRRTLVYGVTVATIGAAFIAAALLLQSLLRPITGGSDVAIAGSTLITVAAFQPLRRRIQSVVDRRFYRSSYDAARTLDVFAARMRDEVDINALRGEVLDVVASTLRPAHASVWLRK
jgi:tryptophan-rich sensory protein